MRTISLSALAAICLLTGCSSAHLSSEPSSGLYELSVSGELDRCSPARGTGSMGLVGVVSAGDVLSLGVPDPTRDAMLHVSLSRPAGFHDTFSVPLEGCTTATLERSFTIVESDGARLGLAYRERWTGMDTCGEIMRSLMPAAPSGDCEAELGLTYELAEACAAPCEVHLAAGGPVCACD
jgi:hypothetical protein